MRFLFPLLVAGLLCACGKSDDKPPPNIMEGQLKGLQKAKQVEKDVQKAADAQRQAIEKETDKDTASKPAE
ncbi:hypothetical protein [Undibacterium terreum]|uniref:Lipoprotein n=1 Tax=Undibacterium terreum TaxID=1224302 RepID=A0A916XB52_9BURK|nr:hypothetical protein [Undibacterium terreum]GGC60451.1 hypothetical protein GCM10011396_04160 [Undibacterium terreum]